MAFAFNLPRNMPFSKTFGLTHSYPSSGIGEIWFQVCMQVATSIVFNRVPDQNLPDFGPQKDIRISNVLDIVTVNKDDLEARRCRYLI